MNRSDHDQFHIDLLAVATSGCRLQIDDQSSMARKSRLIKAIQKYQVSSSSLLELQPTAVNEAESLRTFSPIAPTPTNESEAESAEPSSDIPSMTKLDLMKADPLEALDSSDLPRRYVAALKTFAMTSQMTPVLDGLSVRYLAQEQLRRILYWPTIYLLMLLAVGTYGMLLFHGRVVPLIADFRRDGDPLNKIDYQQIDFEKWFPFLTYGMIGLGLFAIFFMLFGGAAQLVRSLGGKQYVDDLINSVCMRCVPVLLSAGLSKEDSVALSCELSGMTEESKQKILKYIPSDNPGYWQIAAAFWSASATSRLARLKLIVPILLVLGFGGLFSIAYCVALFGPLFTAISKLSQ